MANITKEERERRERERAENNTPSTSDLLPAAYSDESLASSLSSAEDSGAFVISEEWDGMIERGDPFKEKAEEWIKANPDKEFRYLGKATMARHGTRDYRPVRDKSGKTVEVQGMPLSWVPKDVYKERRRRAKDVADAAVGKNLEKHQEIQENIVAATGGGMSVLNLNQATNMLGNPIRSSTYDDYKKGNL